MNDIGNNEKDIIKKHTKRVTCFAHFDKNNTIQDYVIYYLKELKKVSDTIIFVSDSNLPDTEIEKIRPYINHSIAQKHGEYDFGSYKRGYFYAKENNLLENCEELIFANDSCYGPLFPFEDMFNKMTPRNVDFWGVTENNEGITGIIDAYRHIQSYFMVFKSQIFNNELFIDFIKNIKQELSKEEIVAKYEIGISIFLHEQGFTSDSYCEISKQIPIAYLNKYKELIMHNQLPLIKRSIFLNNIPDISNTFFKKYTSYDYELIKKDAENKKKVSVIIPCYNKGKYVKEAVESVINQTYQNIEIVCIDDCSTDNSYETLKELANKYENIILLRNEENKGVVYSRNTAIEKATGEYILPLDADDTIDPAYIEKAARILDTYNQVGVVYCKYKYFGDSQREIEIPEATKEYLLYSSCISCCSMFRKKDFQKIGGYKECMKNGCEDWELWLTFFENGYGFHRIDEYMLNYRKEKDTRTKHANNNIKEVKSNLIKHHIELYLSDDIFLVKALTGPNISQKYKKYKKLFNLLLVLAIIELVTIIIIIGAVICFQ